MYSGNKYLFMLIIDTQRVTITNIQVGCPIQKSMDQSLFSAPHGLSQSITSFIASYCQGIHQTPFSRLIWSRKSQMRLPSPTGTTLVHMAPLSPVKSHTFPLKHMSVCLNCWATLLLLGLVYLTWTTLFVSNQDTLRWSRKRPDPNASPTNVRNQNEINPTLRAIKQCW